MYEKCHVNDLHFLLRKHGGSYYIWLQHLNFFPNEGQLLSAGELPRAAWDHQLRTMDVCLTKAWQRLSELEYDRTAKLNALVLESGWVWIWLY